jgi:hypothetical protein
MGEPVSGSDGVIELGSIEYPASTNPSLQAGQASSVFASESWMSPADALEDG